MISGKTASGKDTVVARLLQKHPEFRKIITTTSRPMRQDEANGRDYNFIPREEFEKKIQDNEFAEYVEYAGNLYGTQKKELSQGENLIWRIDPSYAGKVKDTVKDKNLLVIYLTVDDETVLRRLRERGLSEEEINARMKDDANLWAQYKDKYDYVVENVPDQLDQTLDKIEKIMENHAS